MESPAPSDRELMERTAAGDREAFADLVRRHQASVLSIAYRFLGDRAEAEDAAQGVFIRLWESARRYRPEAPLPAYLRTLTVNLCLDLKRKARFVVLEAAPEAPGGEHPGDLAEAAERRSALNRALASLAPAQRMAVVLFHMEGLGVKEISDALETSPKAVESLLSRARATLRERLGGILR
jgi:RNA polymerase sigma-70 factor (ECF subfamily)